MPTRPGPVWTRRGSKGRRDSVSAGAETLDSLLGGRVALVQPGEGYRAAIDPVLLAAAVMANPEDTVLDFGCGTGAAALCLAARLAGCRVVGVEADPATADLARRSAQLNGLADRISVFDRRVEHLPGPGMAPVERVMANPPYLAEGTYTASPHPDRRRTDGEAGGGLPAWIDAAYRCLAPKGWLTLIHRADRLQDIVTAVQGRFGAVSVMPLWPKAGQPARRILVTARRDSRSPSRLLPGLVLHGPDGRFTPAAEAVLRDGAALPFD